MQSRTSTWLTLSVFVIGLALAISPAFPSMAGTMPPFEISGEIPISTVDSAKYIPAVAYNSIHDEYLVVWHNRWLTGRDIYGQRISSRGQLIGGAFTIAPMPGAGNFDRAQPSVAYDPDHDRYLVVFIHDVYGDGSDWDIGGRFISWNGPDSSLPEFPICTWSSSQWNPVVVYGQTQQEFLVAWSNTPVGQAAYVSAARLNHNTGVVLDDFLISGGTENQINPDVAYNLAHNEYLVVWDRASSSHDIYGLRLNGNGVAQGTEFVIAGWPDSEETPTVAACSGADQYLVGWQSLVNPPTDYDVYARYVSGGGTPMTVFPVFSLSNPETEIEAACNKGGRQYLLTWQEMYATTNTYGIWARSVHPDGQMDTAFELVGPTATADRITPAVSGGWTNYLAVWVHNRNSGAYQDIRGRMVYLSLLYLPLIRR